MITIPWTKEEIDIIKNNINIMTIKQLAKKFLPHRDYKKVCYKVHQQGLSRDKSIRLPCKYIYNQDYWKKPNIYNSYLAGIISADGCVLIDSKGVYGLEYSISVNDEDLIDLFIQQLNGNFKKYYRYQKSSRSNNLSKHVRIKVNSFDKCAIDLAKYYNITPNKTKRLGPTNIQDININLAYILGFFMGDGHVGFSYGRNNRKRICIGFTSSAKNILDWIKKIFDLYFPYENHEKSIANITYNRFSHCHKYIIGGVRAAIILDYLDQIPVYKLPRKFDNKDIKNYINQKKQQSPHLFIPYVSLKTLPT